MSSATETFSAPAEVHTFDGLLSDFDGTIVDSTDGMKSLFTTINSTVMRKLTIPFPNSNCQALAQVSQPQKLPTLSQNCESDTYPESVPSWA